MRNKLTVADPKRKSFFDSLEITKESKNKIGSLLGIMKLSETTQVEDILTVWNDDSLTDKEVIAIISLLFV